MNKNQVSPRELFLFPESKQAIESMLDPALESAFVFAETERFGAWLNFAMWERTSDAKVVETVLLARLSDEPDLDWKKAALQYVKQKRNLSGSDLNTSSGEFVLGALEEYKTIHGPPKPQHLGWAVEKKTVVGPEKFHKVEHLISQVGGDRVDLLGVETASWILKKQKHGELEYASKSWGGTIDPTEYWETTSEIFRVVFQEVT